MWKALCHTVLARTVLISCDKILKRVDKHRLFSVQKAQIFRQIHSGKILKNIEDSGLPNSLTLATIEANLGTSKDTADALNSGSIGIQKVTRIGCPQVRSEEVQPTNFLLLQSS